MAQTISIEWRVARKPHRCIWCGESIKIGERYKHWRGKFDGDMQSNDWHKECDDAAAKADVYDDGFEAYEFQRGTPDLRNP